MKEIFKEPKEILEESLTCIQIFAIVIGGFRAYRKFGREKKAETAIRIKALLMEYKSNHNRSAMQYRIALRETNDEPSAYVEYVKKMMLNYNNLVEQIHLSIYLPKTIRKMIFNTVWLTIGNEHGENREKLDTNRSSFETQITEINQKLEDIVEM